MLGEEEIGRWGGGERGGKGGRRGCCCGEGRGVSCWVAWLVGDGGVELGFGEAEEMVMDIFLRVDEVMRTTHMFLRCF